MASIGIWGGTVFHDVTTCSVDQNRTPERTDGPRDRTRPAETMDVENTSWGWSVQRVFISIWSVEFVAFLTVEGGSHSFSSSNV